MIYFASDHAGFKLKSELVAYVKELGYEVSDKGPSTYDAEDDYPDFIKLVAEEVSKNPKESRGIVMGGGGQGEAIVANRFQNVRAVVFYGGKTPREAIDAEGTASEDSLEVLKLSRSHNDANVLSLAARFLSTDEAKEGVRVWLETPFFGEERHIRRIQKIERVSKLIR